MLLLGGVTRGDRLQVGHLLERRAGGDDGQTPRDEEIAGVAVGHVLDLTGLGDVGDVLFEQNLHANGLRSSRIEQMC